MHLPFDFIIDRVMDLLDVTAVVGHGAVLVELLLNSGLWRVVGSVE